MPFFLSLASFGIVASGLVVYFGARRVHTLLGRLALAASAVFLITLSLGPIVGSDIVRASFGALYGIAMLGIAIGGVLAVRRYRQSH